MSPMCFVFEEGKSSVSFVILMHVSRNEQSSLDLMKPHVGVVVWRFSIGCGFCDLNVGIMNETFKSNVK